MTIKTITLRIYSQTDADLIEMAINKSGASQSDWARNALLMNAEIQIMKGGLIGHALKNILLLRRLSQVNGNHSKSQIVEAMEWSATEFEKIFKPNEDQ